MRVDFVENAMALTRLFTYTHLPDILVKYLPAENGKIFKASAFTYLNTDRTASDLAVLYENGVFIVVTPTQTQNASNLDSYALDAAFGTYAMMVRFVMFTLERFLENK